MGLFSFLSKKEVSGYKDYTQDDPYMNSGAIDDAGDALNPALRAVKHSHSCVSVAYDPEGQLTLTCGNRTPRQVQSLVNAVGAKAALRLLEKAGAPVATRSYRTVDREADTDTSSLEKHIEPTYYSNAHVTKRR